MPEINKAYSVLSNEILLDAYCNKCSAEAYLYTKAEWTSFVNKNYKNFIHCILVSISFVRTCVIIAHIYAHVPKELIEQFGVFALMSYIAICLARYIEHKNKMLTEAKNAKYKKTS